jgi:hypothetical protein
MYKGKEYKETPILDNFKDICQIIADCNYNSDTFQSCILILYDACIRKELDQVERN